jgi:ABC-type glycerol-3-phosphate transport system permease component
MELLALVESSGVKLNNRRLLTGQSILLYLALAAFVLAVIVPFYWLMKASVSTPEQLVEIPPVYFPKVVLDNFYALAQQIPLGSYIFNSLIFSASTAVATVFFSFLAAYAFARIKFKGSSLVLWGLVVTMALPEIATIIPLYKMLGSVGLLDSLFGLTFVMTSALAPFTVWVFVPFIQQVPESMEEAAVIDGANLWTIIWRIYLPVCKPAIFTMLIINFVNAWNNLLYPLAFSATAKSKCLSVAITEVFQAQVPWGKPWHLISALGVIMVVPVVILILLSQKAVVKGLTKGAVK